MTFIPQEVFNDLLKYFDFARDKKDIYNILFVIFKIRGGYLHDANVDASTNDIVKYFVKLHEKKYEISYFQFERDILVYSTRMFPYIGNLPYDEIRAQFKEILGYHCDLPYNIKVDRVQVRLFIYEIGVRRISIYSEMCLSTEIDTNYYDDKQERMNEILGVIDTRDIYARYEYKEIKGYGYSGGGGMMEENIFNVMNDIVMSVVSVILRR